MVMFNRRSITLLFSLVAMTSLEATSSLISPTVTSGVTRTFRQNQTLRSPEIGSSSSNSNSNSNNNSSINLHSNSFKSDEETPLSNSALGASRYSGGGGKRLYNTLRARGGDMNLGFFSAIANMDREKLVMAVALFATYFSVMGAKCALPSTFNLIMSAQSGLNFYGQEPQQLIAKVLVISTGAISLGKFLLGPVIDKYGGVFCLKVALSLLMGCLAMIASTSSFGVFAVSWIMVDFIFSSCWAACLNAIHQTYQEEEWASRIGLLAVAGRVGNALSFFAFASVLQIVQAQRQSSSIVAAATDGSWRVVFWVSSLLQLFPLFTFGIYQRIKDAKVVCSINNNNHQHAVGSKEEKIAAIPSQQRRTMKDSLKILGGEAKYLSFWMHLISRSCLMIVASFLLFVPSYMANAFGMSSSESARVGSLYALGSLLVVTFFAKPYSMMNVNKKIISTVVLLGSLLGCSLLHMAHIAGVYTISSLGATVSMFLWGVSFSIPFYIPPSMYALKRGGSESSATIADAFDFGGFMMLAWFNGFVAGRQQEVLMSWFAPFCALTIFSAVSLVTLIIATLTES
uniref:Major facilitator superfamily (MFS) profile domain-containing protein n=1 Tax=Chaetoceros debilis TaxID=122233 RepID=A0A7S3PV17_9STRA